MPKFDLKAMEERMLGKLRQTPQTGSPLIQRLREVASKRGLPRLPKIGR